MKNLAIDEAAWASPWRRRSVSEKVVLCGGLLVLALMVPWPLAFVAAGLTVLITVGVAEVPVRLALRAVAAPAAFVLTGAATVAVVITPPPALGLSVTDESVHRAVQVLARSTAATTALLLLAFTTPMVDLLSWLRRRGVPAACVDVAGLMYRLVFVLLGTVGSIRASQQARLGYSSMSRSMHSVGVLMAALFVRAWDRARRLETGLASRSFGDECRTVDRHEVISLRFVAMSVVLLAALAVAGLIVSGVGR